MRFNRKFVHNFGRYFQKTKTEDLINNKNCSEFEVNNWIISNFIIKKLVPVVGIKPYPLSEQLLMVATLCRFHPTHIFEWGTNIGKSARIFYETSKYFQIHSNIHSIDLPEEVDHIEHPHKKRAKLLKNIHEINLYQGDGLDISLEICEKITHGNILFFLDGDHDYNSVKRELDGILSTIKFPVILVHDTFYQSSNSHYNIGPYLAIKDILNMNKTQIKTLSMNTGLPGMTLLYHEINLKIE
ncbi:MAG: hypothetical protein APR54_09800 [Candidatus Cloacimonas sp. SDB]|nr:MAG: hypothetical protein APR54_09800 [Candidatus Cloacimonas sp. SDB]